MSEEDKKTPVATPSPVSPENKKASAEPTTEGDANQNTASKDGFANPTALEVI